MIKILWRRENRVTKDASTVDNTWRGGEGGSGVYLQFIALNRLLLRGLLHKVRDEDFQCGSS